MSKIQNKIDDILTSEFWPEQLHPKTFYETTHDDNEGNPLSGVLSVAFTEDGDAWIKTKGKMMLRYRTYDGGGQFPKIRRALLLLAEAIRQEGTL